MMSNSKGKKVRPLGLVRHNISTNDKIPSIPRLSSIVDQKTDDKLDKTYRGIQGNAMAVPPPSSRESFHKDSDSEKTKNSARSTGTIKSDSALSSRTQDTFVTDKKELKEALIREKDLKLQIAALEKLIEELKEELAEKDQIIAELEKKLQTQETIHQSILDTEKQSHENTKLQLEKAEEEIEENKLLIDSLKWEWSQKLENLRLEMETKLSETIETKDKEIAVRNEKLNRLKQQMADALKGNSWERQQQLEELTKELARIQDEADLLRMKLKAHSKSKQGHCQNCSDVGSKLDKTVASMKEKDQTIKDLKSLVTKFEKQLSQQDELLKAWAESKGHKMTPLQK